MKPIFDPFLNFFFIINIYARKIKITKVHVLGSEKHYAVEKIEFDKYLSQIRPLIRPYKTGIWPVYP